MNIGIRESILRRVAGMGTTTLRVFDRWFDELPFELLSELRMAVRLEIVAREHEVLAAEHGGYACVAVGGWQ